MGLILHAAPLIRNFGLDEFREQDERFLPAAVASFDGDDIGHSLLDDVQLGSTRHFLQGDCRLHFSGQTRVVESIRVTDAFLWHQLKIFSAEGVALPVLKFVNDIL